MPRFTVDKDSLGLRLDQFIRRELEQSDAESPASRERIKEWIRAGMARLNGEICRAPDMRLKAADRLELETDNSGPAGLKAEKGALDLIYEDSDLLVLNKPAGLTVHPAPSRADGTLAHRLLDRFPQLREIGGDENRPGLVHRLDKDTSGLMVVALKEAARQYLAEAFARRRIVKIYLALVWGCPERERGEINLPIGRHPVLKTRMAALEKGGRPARSSYAVLYKDAEQRFSLLAVRIHTGRTHQIRAHLSAMGCPIIGDAAYGGKIRRKDGPLPRLAGRQMLHAWRLGFHKADGCPLEFACPPPKDFEALLLHLSRRLQRLIITGPPGGGKSLLLDEFKKQGLPVFSADQAVGELYAKGGDGWEMLRRRFGERFAGEDRAVDKAALFEAMRHDQGLRREVNDLIHPLVFSRLELFWQNHSEARLAAAEIPLFFESGRRAEKDGLLTLTVRCARETRLRHLERSRGWSRATLAALESWQWPEEKKAARSDLLFDNSGSREDFQRKAESLLRELQTRRRKERREALAMFKTLWDAEKSPAKEKIRLLGADSP